MFFPSKSFEISVFFGFKTVKVFLNGNYKSITLHTCSPYSGLLPVVKNTIITLLCEINKNGLYKLTLLHFISTKQAGDRNIKKKVLALIGKGIFSKKWDYTYSVNFV